MTDKHVHDTAEAESSAQQAELEAKPKLDWFAIYINGDSKGDFSFMTDALNELTFLVNENGADHINSVEVRRIEEEDET